MQIVIDIPKEYYKAIMEIPVNQSTADMLIIKYGTPLPEHHSDLIERDALLDNIKDYGEGQSKLMLIDPYYVRRAETIIPATKEKSDCKYQSFIIEIPDNATNGDVIRALFPQYYQNILSYLDNTRWWDSPYKAESEDKK